MRVADESLDQDNACPCSSRCRSGRRYRGIDGSCASCPVLYIAFDLFMTTLL